MLCQVCKQREATFHFKEVIQDERRELHLCEICAREMNLLKESFFTPSFSLSNLMTGLANLEIPLVPKEQKICPGCGLSYEDIRRKGKMGCSSCYQTFREYIIPLLERIHGKAHHSGKTPEKGKGQDERIKKIYDLRRKLEDAVRKEDYEKAAKLRDEIHNLEKTGKRNESSKDG